MIYLKIPAIKANIFSFALTLFFTMSVVSVFSQSDKEVIVQADKHFQTESYHESMRLYSQLLSLHRNDPFYSYRFGVSMLYSDRRDPNSAIRYIEAGLGKLEGDDAIMINYHLGTAYHLTFRFIEALRFYNIFKERSIHKKFAIYNVNHRIAMCRNGISLLQNIRDLYVFEKHHVPLESFFRSYNINRFGGRLLIKPEQFKSKFDKKLEESTIIFLSDTQNVVYYSSYGRDGKNGKDIYRSFKLGDGSWTSPERLSNAINTEHDEDYPFILPDGKTLYFSSKGHNSMGGFDIFRSTWDEQKKDWTTPINLDFAINTPYDDILFVTDKDERYAYFSSVRNSGLNQINVYMVRIDIRPEDSPGDMLAQVVNMSADVKDENYVTAVQKIQQISNLEVNASKDEFDRKDNERRKQLYADNYKYNISDNPTDDELINLTFSYANDAERSFQMLRQKRQATEMSAERFKERNRQYSEEAEKLYSLALEETNAQTKKTLGEQATEMSKKAAESQSQHVNAINLMNELTTSVDFQKNEYDKILFKAGEIQRLASGRQIDTSVVLLKQLIDDIKTYEIAIEEYIASIFPSNEIIDQYKDDISIAQKNILEINDSIKNLAKEKDVYKNELLLEKNPDRRNDLLLEVNQIDNEVELLQSRKNQLNENIQKTNENITLAEIKLSQTQSELFTEIAMAEDIIKSNPDAISTYINNTNSNQQTTSTDQQTTSTDQQTTSTDQQTTSTDQQTTSTDQQTTSTDQQTTSTDQQTTSTDQQTTSMDQQTTSTDQQTTSTDQQTTSTDQQTTSTDQQTTSTDQQTTSTDQQTTSTDQQTTSTDQQTTSTDQQTTSTDQQTTSTDQQTTSTDQQTTSTYQQTTSTDQQTTSTDQQKETTIIEKTQKLEEVLSFEKAIINIRKHESDRLTNELITKIETTEKELTIVNQILSDPSLSLADKRIAEIKAERLIATYTEDLKELDKLLLLQKQIASEVEAFEKMSDVANTHIESINRYVDEGNERKATTEFTKLSDLVEQSSHSENTSIQGSVQEYVSNLNAEADQFKSKSNNADKGASEYKSKSEKAFEKAEKAKNESKKQQFIEEGLKYDLLSQTLKDSATYYRDSESDKRQHAEQIAKSETQLSAIISSIQEKASDTNYVETFTPSSRTISTQTIQRMQSLIADNPYSDRFPTIITEANQWSNVISTKESQADFLLTSSSNTKAGEILAVENGNYSSSQLEEIREREKVFILRSAASLHITRISQLEEEITNSNNAQTVYSSFNELNRLKESLQNIITEHNGIASKYSDLENLTSAELLPYDELSMDPELSIAAIDKQIQYLEIKLIELQTAAQSITSPIEKERIQKESDKVAIEIKEAEVDRLRILDMSEMNKMLARSIVISNMPFAEIDNQTTNTLNELKTQYAFYEQNAFAGLEQADKMRNMEQKKILLLESYNQTLKAVELQQSIVDIYLKYLPSGTDFTAIAEQNITQAIVDQQKTTEILANLSVRTTDVSSSETATSSTSTSLIDNTVDSDTSDNTSTTDIGTTTSTTSTSSTSSTTSTTSTTSTAETATSTSATAAATSTSATAATTSSAVTSDKSTIITDIRSADYQPYYSDTNPIPPHTAADGILLFRVQFAASRRPAPENSYVGMTPLFYEQSEGWYRYMHGEFYNPDNAIAARNQVRTLGYRDAFVVAYYNGKRITNAEARGLYAGITQPTLATQTEAVIIVNNAETTTVAAGVNIDFNQLEGLYFAVQIGVYGGPRTPERLFGINPLIEDRLPNGNYRYMTGTYGTIDEANTARDVIRAGGVPDAYVVAYRNGVRISVREAQTFIESGEKTTNVRFEPISSPTSNEALAESTFFRVQLGAYRNQVPVEVVNAFISISGDGIDILSGNDNMTIYVTGKFKTQNEAEQLKNKVQNGGIPDAFIIAVQGDKKISIQEAKEILKIQ